MNTRLPTIRWYRQLAHYAEHGGCYHPMFDIIRGIRAKRNCSWYIATIIAYCREDGTWL